MSTIHRWFAGCACLLLVAPACTFYPQELDPPVECSLGLCAAGPVPDHCTNWCNTNGNCGDGIVQGRERCDNGDANSDETPDACRTRCTPAYCGDGVPDSDEQCDDGNDVVDDGCTPNCTFDLCGNGVADAGEECDDGNRDNQDGCLVTCVAARCGDGIRRADITDPLDPLFEACDDGDELLDDDCPDGPTGTCVLAFCGDGFVDLEEPAVEVCDPQAGVNGTCDSTCGSAR